LNQTTNWTERPPTSQQSDRHATHTRPIPRCGGSIINELRLRPRHQRELVLWPKTGRNWRNTSLRLRIRCTQKHPGHQYVQDTVKCNGFSIVCATEGHQTFNIEWAYGSSKRGQQGLNGQPSAAGPHNNGVVRIQCHTAEFGQSIRSACYCPHKWLMNAQQTINNVLSTRVGDDVKSTLHERGSWRYKARSQQMNRNE